jgi:hypothetical protein
MEEKRPPKPEDLGEGPESRMEGIPPPKKKPHEQEGDRLIQPPGVPKPEEADATGEGDVEAQAEETDRRAIEEREKDARKRIPSVRPRPGEAPPPE